MAWSPQARAKALEARRAHRHMGITKTGHHGIRGGQTQPVNQSGHQGRKIKKYAKVAAVGAGVAAVGGGAAYIYYNSNTQKGMRAYSHFKVNEGKVTRAGARAQNGPHPRTGIYHTNQKRHESLNRYEARRNRMVRRAARREARYKDSRKFLAAASREHSRRSREHFPTRNKVYSQRMPAQQLALPRGR
jgi:hypothetical protein